MYESFLTEETLTTIEERRRAKRGWKTVQYQELKRVAVRVVRIVKAALVGGVCEAVETHLRSTDDSRDAYR